MEWIYKTNNDRYFLMAEFFKVFYPETKDVTKAMHKSLEAMCIMMEISYEYDKNTKENNHENS